jgi:hypothetical protein
MAQRPNGSIYPYTLYAVMPLSRNTFAPFFCNEIASYASCIKNQLMI